MTRIHASSGSNPVNVRNYLEGFCTPGMIEVPSTLPDLIFSFGADVALTSPTSIHDFITALSAGVAATGNSWRLLDTLGTGVSANRAVIIGGPVGSPLKDARAVVAISDTNLIDVAARGDNISNVVYQPYVSFCPDGGGNFNAFGAGASDVSDGNFFVGGTNELAFKGTRETRFQAFHQSLNTIGMDSVTLWDTLETLTIIPIKSNVNRVAHFGATVMPPNDAAAEADGRIYGLHTSSLIGLNISIHGTSTCFPCHHTTIANNKGMIFNPAVPTTLITLTKPTLTFESASLGTTPLGPGYASSIPLNNRLVPYTAVGWLRQIGRWSDQAHGTPVTDRFGSTVGLAMAKSPAFTTYDTLVFSNIGNQG